MTEGIYRLAGSNIKINRLLSLFRSNAWSVQISREDYSENDVANVLKRFIRQLDEPLLTEQLRDGFLSAASIEQVRDFEIILLKYFMNNMSKLFVGG